MFSKVCPFFIKIIYEYEFPWHPNRRYTSNFTAKNVLLIFQIEQNGTFLYNFKYDYWILHKKLVWDEIFTIFHKITHISFNIGPRILNLHTLGHPFPLADHK